MNGDSQTSANIVPTYRQKANLLSTYLVSDEEDETNDSLNDSTHRNDPLNGSSFEGGIEVLPRSFSTIRTNNTNRSMFNGNAFSDHFESANNESVQSAKICTWSDDTIESSTPRRSQYRITFEIIKAKTVTSMDKGFIGSRNRFERSNKYVCYTVLIKRSPGLETKPAVIERRYSDFLNFHNTIKKRYPALLKEVPFPKKILIGNFSPEVIAARSLAFQNFLSFCLSVPEIRGSKEFAIFLFHPELKEAKRCLQSIYLEDAANILENVYFIQDKLAMHSGQPNAQLLHTMIALIGCLNAVDNTAEARKLANKTFEMLFATSTTIVRSTSRNASNGSQIYEISDLYEASELVFPLILLSLRLRWFSGHQKLLLENKLEELCRKRSLPRNFDSQPTLLEIILRKDFCPILD